MERDPLVEHRIGLAGEDFDVMAEVDERLGQMPGVDPLASDGRFRSVGQIGEAERALGGGLYR